jgi:hypothetical protein
LRFAWNCAITQKLISISYPALRGVDYGVEAGRFGVVYHLSSIPYHLQLFEDKQGE